MGSAEEVVLLAEDMQPIGTALKSEVHSSATPLHLAFSCYLFAQDDRRILMTRRALTKIAWPGVWSNSFCGHPMPGEAAEDALKRRGASELGVGVENIRLVLPHFRYQARDAGGILENEVCPVFFASLAGSPNPNAAEVCDWSWIDKEGFAEIARSAPWLISPWAVLQVTELARRALL